MFDAILTAVTLLLQQNAVLQSAGVSVSRRKRGAKWDTDRLPCLFVSGGRVRDAEPVMGGAGQSLMIRDYQVFAALIYPGGYQFRSNQGLLPNIGRVVRGALLVSTLPGTTVFRSAAVPSDEYEDEALAVGFDMNLSEIWYAARESRQ